jgi:uncharacterized phage protein (TIGR02218 family)
MGFLTSEISRLLGYPQELYLFRIPGAAWYFTSADREFDGSSYGELDDELFLPAAIKRSSVELSREIDRNVLTIDAAHTFPPAQQWFGGAPEGVMSLEIFRIHTSDSTGELAKIWQGRVISVAFKGHAATMSCEPIFTSLKRSGIRSVYGVPCRYILFSAQCGADPALFRLTGTVAAINGAAVDVVGLSGQPDGYWINGKVNAGPNKTFIRAIVGHTGDTITLDRVISSLIVGDPIDVLPGCAHDVNDCTNKFNNLLNYGGFPFIPRKDPFSGDAITN